MAVREGPPASMRDRRVLFISNDATQSGAPILLLHFLRWLRDHSPIPFEILLRAGGDLLGEFKAVGPTSVLEPEPGSAWDSLPLAARVRRRFILTQLASRRVGPIYSNTITNGRELQVLGPAGRPVLTHVHELETVIQSCGKENWDQVKRHTRTFIASSNAVRANLVERHGIAPGAISLVHEFIPVQPGGVGTRDQRGAQVRRELGLAADAKIVGACGAVNWRKAPDLFLLLADAVRRRRPVGPPAHFVWIGDTMDGTPLFERLQHDIRMLQLEGLVHFVGQRSSARDYFSAFDVFALVSREDPFPLVCLEAASAGTPIVCFDGAGGEKEFVEHDCGFVVPYLNVEVMADCVLRLLESDELRRACGARAAEKVRVRHDVSVAAPKILEILHRLMAEGDV